MTLAPTVLQVQLEVNGFSRNVATRKPGPKTHWEKNGPRKGCCHGAVVGIAWAVPSNNVFFRTSVRYKENHISLNVSSKNMFSWGLLIFKI